MLPIVIIVTHHIKDLNFDPKHYIKVQPTQSVFFARHFEEYAPDHSSYRPDVVNYWINCLEQIPEIDHDHVPYDLQNLN